MNEEIKKQVEKLNNYLKALGFKKKSLTWFKEKKEFTLLIGLQKSSWSPEYYVNVGIMLEKKDVKDLKTYKSEVQYRVDEEDNNQKVKDIYQLDKEMDKVITLIQDQVINIFSNLETLEEITSKIMKNKNRYILTVRAKEILHMG